MNKMLNVWVIMCLLLITSQVMAGTVGYWKFEEGSGQTTANEEIAARDLTLRRGTSTSSWADPEWTTNGISGNAMHYINVQGSSEGGRNFLLPNSGVDISLLILGTFTVEVWIKLDSVSVGWDDNNPYYIISIGDNGSSLEQNYYMRAVGGDNDEAELSVGWYYGDGTSFKEYKHNTKLSVDQWHHVAFSHDADATSNNTKIWLDGVEQIHNTTAHPYISQSDPQFIVGATFREGATDYRRRSFDGYIDEVRISDTMLATEDLLYPMPLPPKGTLIILQ